jgi:hypothetical protein
VNWVAQRYALFAFLCGFPWPYRSAARSIVLSLKLASVSSQVARRKAAEFQNNSALPELMARDLRKGLAGLGTGTSDNESVRRG